MSAAPTNTTLPIRPSATVPHDEDSDPTSSSGSDSSSEEESSEDEDEKIHHENQDTSSGNTSSMPHVQGRPKPRIQKMNANSELMARLSAFLPQMKTANEDLEKEIAEGRGEDVVLDNVDDGKDYIEMNLGLGVLEEKRDDQDNSSDDEGDDEMGGTGSDNKGKEGQDSDILGKLMGGKDVDVDKPAIEDLGQ